MSALDWSTISEIIQGGKIEKILQDAKEIAIKGKSLMQTVEMLEKYVDQAKKEYGEIKEIFEKLKSNLPEGIFGEKKK